MDTKLNKFGKIFVTEIRDNTINSLDKMLNGIMKGVTAEKVQEKILALTNEQIDVIRWLIPQIVDIDLYNMLFMIEEHDDLELLFEKENLKEASDSLSGELYTEDGWIAKFSNERYEE
jgi:hypothetical protein